MVAGNTNTVATKAYCHRQYWLMRNSQLYWTLQNTWTYPTAQTYVERLFSEVPTAKYQLQLAVITNITSSGSSYHVAEELAIPGGMHLILLGKKKEKLRTIEEKLIKESKRRGLAKANDPNYYKNPIVYKVQYDPNSIESILQAANDIRHIASSASGNGNNEDGGGGHNYSNKISMLIHNPAGVTVAYETTKVGDMEINVGRNFVAPHILTQQLLPQLREAATTTYKPRIVYVVSVGHCQGTDFDPERFLELPSEGGSPEGTLVDPSSIAEGRPLISRGGNSGDYVAPTLTDDDDDNNNGANDNEEDNNDNDSPASASNSNNNNNKNDKVYIENEELDGPVTMYYRAHMATIANAMAMAKEEPTLAPMCVYPGSVATNSKTKSLGIAETIYQKGFYFFNLSPSQAARASLRAALDPDIDAGALPTGSYLHCDGNPWTVADPTVEDPNTPGVPYQWIEYSRMVRECALKLSDRLLSDIQQQQQQQQPGEQEPPEQPPAPAAVAAAAAGTMTTTEGETEKATQQENGEKGDLLQLGVDEGDAKEEAVEG